MISSTRALEIRLGALQAASFVSQGVYLPFFPLWLQSKALSPTIIGFVVAIPIIVRIIATAPLLSLADRSFGARRLLLASHLGQMLGFPLLMLTDSSAVIITLVALVAFVSPVAAQVNIMDPFNIGPAMDDANVLASAIPYADGDRATCTVSVM